MKKIIMIILLSVSIFANDKYDRKMRNAMTAISLSFFAASMTVRGIALYSDGLTPHSRKRHITVSNYLSSGTMVFIMAAIPFESNIRNRRKNNVKSSRN